MTPSPAELKYFLEVANTLNVSRASERLGVSQPSLSSALKRLEQTLGAEVFVRHKQGVSLTQAGKQLQLHARQLLTYWEQTRSKALASQQEVQGYFTLGCHSTVAMYLASKFLSQVLETHPKLEIHLKNDISRKTTEQVINLSIDIGIVVNPIAHPDLIIKKLCDDRVTFWVSKHNNRNQDYANKHSIILCQSDLEQTQFLLKKAKDAGIHSERILTMGSLEVIAHLAASGCGVGILPERVAKVMSPNQLTPIANAPFHPDEICVVYRHENRNIEAIQAIIEAIKKSVE